MKHSARIFWKKEPQELFVDGEYSRTHMWSFDGGAKLIASSSPQVVPIPMSDPSVIDPEEAFLASLSSCHMLFFLSIAMSQKYSVKTYEDNVCGTLGKNKKGKTAIEQIKLNPKVIFCGSKQPSMAQVVKMHDMAHARCFIANTIQSEISIHPLI
ncbi:OsmC family protein [Aquimarina sediminis]|uniref:OsmC family protein n=1 Tax=Aquimarina sediminis TaxID=2070536 RepID=UPI000CA05678|nr:OsmC family protein [Aquimarina sediminis]